MPHTDGGETPGKYRNISPRSSSPVSQNIIHNTGRESLNQFIKFYLIGLMSPSFPVKIIHYTLYAFQQYNGILSICHYTSQRPTLCNTEF